MPLKTPIEWQTILIEQAGPQKGCATPYFQRLLLELMKEAANSIDTESLDLLQVDTLTPSVGNQVDDVTNQLIPNVPLVQEPQDAGASLPFGVPFSGFIPPEAVQEIALLAATLIPMSPPSEGGDMTAAEVAALGYWAPVTDATDPMDPLFVFDAEGQCVVAFVPTP